MNFKYVFFAFLLVNPFGNLPAHCIDNDSIENYYLNLSINTSNHIISDSPQVIKQIEISWAI